MCLPLLLLPLVAPCSIQYFLTVDSTTGVGNRAGQAMSLLRGPRPAAGSNLSDDAPAVSADTVDPETDAAVEDGTGQ